MLHNVFAEPSSKNQLSTTGLDEALAQSLSANGYTDIRMLHGQICALKRFNYTTAVVVDIGVAGYQRRYCFEPQEIARAALWAWDGHRHPSGPWIKCKGFGIDLLNPLLS
jgi:hypothetical protein